MKIDISEIIFYGIFLLYLIIEKFLIPRKLEKIKSELSGKLEEIKSLYSKEKYIHRLQFEKEFKIYSELWEKLVDLRDSTALLIPMVDFEDLTKSHEEVQKERYQNVNKAYTDVQKVIYNNKPFYDESVYKSAKDILKKTFSQASAFGSYVGDMGEYLGEAEKRIDEINEIINKIEKAIREQIRNIGKAKLIE